MIKNLKRVTLLLVLLLTVSMTSCEESCLCVDNRGEYYSDDCDDDGKTVTRHLEFNSVDGYFSYPINVDIECTTD